LHFECAADSILSSFRETSRLIPSEAGGILRGLRHELNSCPFRNLWRRRGSSASFKGVEWLFLSSDCGLDGANWGLGAAAAWLRSGFEEVPGLLVFLVFVALAVRCENDGALAFEYADGEEVPDIVGDDVDGEIVEIGRSVGTLVGSDESAAIGRADPSLGALDLHAKKASVVLNGDIVAGGVSPGF